MIFRRIFLLNRPDTWAYRCRILNRQLFFTFKMMKFNLVALFAQLAFPEHRQFIEIFLEKFIYGNCVSKR